MRVIGQSLLSATADWIFGFDFFVSYAHDDGLDYAAALTKGLENRGFSVFLDANVYTAGTALPAETRRRVRMSRHLVVLARPGALHSKWVKREVDECVDKGRVPILVNFDGAIEAAQNSALARQALAGDWLRIEEAAVEVPGSEALDALERAFSGLRREKRRRRIVAATAMTTLIIAGAATFGLYSAEQSRQREEAELSASLMVRATSETDGRRFERAAVFALAATISRRDGHLPAPQQLALANAAMPFAARVLRMGEANTDMVRAVAFSPTSNELAVAPNDGSVHAYDPEEHKYTASFFAHGTYTQHLAFSPDGTKLVSSGDDGVRLWSWPEQQPLATLLATAEEQVVSAIAFSPDGQRFATGGHDAVLRLWDLSGAEVASFSDFKQRASAVRKNAISAIAYSPDGRRIAVALEDNTVEIRDAVTGAVLFRIDDLESTPRGGNNFDHVSDLAFSNDSTLIATGSYDGKVRVWNAQQGMQLASTLEPVQSNSLSGYRVNALLFTEIDRYIIIGVDNGDILVREVATGAIVAKLFGHTSPISDLTLATNGRSQAMGSLDGFFRIQTSWS